MMFSGERLFCSKTNSKKNKEKIKNCHLEAEPKVLDLQNPDLSGITEKERKN